MQLNGPANFTLALPVGPDEHLHLPGPPLLPGSWHRDPIPGTPTWFS